MEHLAIDLGGKESQICVRSSDGQIVEERRCRTAALPAYLATRPRSRVVVETCSEAFELRMPHWGSGTRSVWCRGRWCGPWASGRDG
jgi:hypothetical protein